MPASSWSSFTKRIAIHADPRIVFNAWSTPLGLESWFLRKAEFINTMGLPREKHETIQSGDKYEWLWFGYPDNVVENKHVTETNGIDFIQFHFTGNCLVSVKIKKVEAVAMVELIQEHIPEDPDPLTNLYIGCGEGWVFYLANLKSVLEGGIDLRNKNEKFPGVIN